MKKIGIVTIISENYGNRLQNYALQEYIKKFKDCNVETIRNNEITNTRRFYFLRKIKHYFIKKQKSLRSDSFERFNENINFSSCKMTAYNNIDKKYDFFISGSDQVWNPLMERLREVDYLKMINNKKKISYAASFGISNIPSKYETIVSNYIAQYKNLSVRENEGKEIIQSLTDRKDVEVLIDPTMLLDSSEWKKIEKKPNINMPQKYILKYFLGKNNEKYNKEIQYLAEKLKYEIIDLYDKNSPFYNVGPAEFLYLERNAKIICTDSFHSAVFSVIFDNPFVIFERDSTTSDCMNSRLNTLIDKFNLKDRKFNGINITEKNLKHNYSEAYKILDIEREKSKKYLTNALKFDGMN